MNTKYIKAIFATLMLTVLCASAYVSAPTITDGIGFQYGNVTVGSDNIQIGGSNVTRTATVVVAAADSPHPEQADYVCDGVDDQVEINAALAIGDTFLMAGKYHTSGPIRMIYDRSVLLGAKHSWGRTGLENGGTQIYLDYNSNCNIIEIQGQASGLEDGHIYFPTIEGMYLNGRGLYQSSGHGIYLHENISDAVLKDIAVHDCCQTGIYVNAGWLTSLINVWSEGNHEWGFVVGSGEPKLTHCHSSRNLNGMYVGSNIVMSACTVSENDQMGIQLNHANHAVIVGNKIYSNSKENTGVYSDIKLSDTSHSCIITNNFIDGESTAKHGIEIGADVYNCLISQNRITGHTSAEIIDASTSYNQIRNNFGFVTENSGTATLSSGITSIAVDHGLDVTPSTGDIVVTPIENWGSMTKFWIGNYTSSQFTIYADQNPGQDVDFAWKAIIL